MGILKDLHIVNPFNDDDLRLIEDYSKEQDISLYEELKQIKKLHTEEQYKQQETFSIVNNKIFYTISDGKLANLINVKLERDTKTASVYPKININKKNIIPELCDYLITNYDMEEVFVFIEKSDKKTITNLLQNDFLSLLTKDDTEEYVPFLKEHEIEKERSNIWKY